MSKKTQYKVLTLSVSGKNNIIHRIGDVVSGDEFNNIEALIKGDFIELVTEQKDEKKSDSKSSKK